MWIPNCVPGYFILCQLQMQHIPFCYMNSTIHRINLLSQRRHLTCFHIPLESRPRLGYYIVQVFHLDSATSLAGSQFGNHWLNTSPYYTIVTGKLEGGGVMGAQLRVLPQDQQQQQLFRGLQNKLVMPSISLCVWLLRKSGVGNSEVNEQPLQLLKEWSC